MTHSELKRFFMTHPPTGVDIANLVRDNQLEGWRVEIERKYQENTDFNHYLNKYRYEITFERTVS